MATQAVENYIKHVRLAQQAQRDADSSQGEEPYVAMGELAAAVGVTPGTATGMVKALADGDLVIYKPRGGVRLTPAGEELADAVLRRHRLVELFLVNVVGLDWSEVHAEAEVLEHAISDKLLDRIDDLLGRPAADPHGDPIPRPDDLAAPAVEAWPLSACPVGVSLTVSRVTDQSPEFLRFCDRHGLIPGAAVRVSAREAGAEATQLDVRDETDTYRPLTLGTRAAAKVTAVRGDA